MQLSTEQSLDFLLAENFSVGKPYNQFEWLRQISKEMSAFTEIGIDIATEKEISIEILELRSGQRLSSANPKERPDMNTPWTRYEVIFCSVWPQLHSAFHICITFGTLKNSHNWATFVSHCSQWVSRLTFTGSEYSSISCSTSKPDLHYCKKPKNIFHSQLASRHFVVIILKLSGLWGYRKHSNELCNYSRWY